MQALDGKQVAATQEGIRKVLSEFPGPTLTSNGFPHRADRRDPVRLHRSGGGQCLRQRPGPDGSGGRADRRPAEPGSRRGAGSDPISSRNAGDRGAIAPGTTWPAGASIRCRFSTWCGPPTAARWWDRSTMRTGSSMWPSRWLPAIAPRSAKSARCRCAAPMEIM
jgi:hypothetical protein